MLFWGGVLAKRKLAEVRRRRVVLTEVPGGVKPPGRVNANRRLDAQDDKRGCLGGCQGRGDAPSLEKVVEKRERKGKSPLHKKRVEGENN